MTKVVAAEEVGLKEILDDVERNDEVVITRDGEPVAHVFPAAEPRIRMTLEELRAAVRFIGDVESPVEDWDVER